MLNRDTIDSIDSTSSRGTDSRAPSRKANNPRSVIKRSACSLTPWVYSRNMSKRFARVAC